MNKILIVDDERNIGMLLQNFLSADYDVTFIDNSLEALDWLEDNLPDLIISDLQMPDLDGYEFIRKVRLRGFTSHTPIIVLSALQESKERVRCYRLGAQDYLTKPFNPEELTFVIEKNLNPIKVY